MNIDEAVRRLRELENEKFLALMIEDSDERLAKFMELAAEAYQLERLISAKRPAPDQ